VLRRMLQSKCVPLRWMEAIMYDISGFILRRSPWPPMGHG
jgi:hypothetical protein